MNYKGYTGVTMYDKKQKKYYGTVVGIKDVITFQGETILEAEDEFHQSVDDYLNFCHELGQIPDQPIATDS